MSEVLKTTVAVLGAAGAIVAIVAFTSGLGLATKAVVTPVSTRIDNKIFHESQQYNDSMARDLDQFRMEWPAASPEAKDVIRATIRHRFAGYDSSNLAPDAQAFLVSVRGF
jgi:hypothetical protein